MTLRVGTVSCSSVHRGGRKGAVAGAVSGPLRWYFATLILVFFGTLLQLSLSELNPDWLAYRQIYESGASWLSEQGRDPAFSILTSFLAQLLGSDGYESYRVVLGVYFASFVLLLATGRIFKLNLTASGYALLALALVYLGLTRFTIQIREGIGVTMAIVSLALFAKHSKSREQVQGMGARRTCAWRVLRAGVAWCLLILAGLMHASTLFVLLIVLAAWWATKRTRVANGVSLLPRAQPWRLRLIWVVAISLAGLGIAQLYLGGSLERIAAETVGDRLVEPKALSELQLGLWGLYGGACWLVFREVRYSVRQRRIIGMPASFLQILSGPAIAATYASIVLALMLAVNPLFVTNYVRLLHMFLALALLGLAVTGSRRWSMLLVGAFLIADQVRSIADSISIYFGVDLL